MFRRPLLLLPAVLTAIALPVAPALAGEEDDSSSPATLRATQGCVSGDRARASVSGDDIDNVAFFVDGKHVRTVRRVNDQGRFAISMNCSNLRVGAHTGRAVVTFTEGSSPAQQTMRFQITRSRQGTPRFAG